MLQDLYFSHVQAPLQGLWTGCVWPLLHTNPARALSRLGPPCSGLRQLPHSDRQSVTTLNQEHFANCTQVLLRWFTKRHWVLGLLLLKKKDQSYSAGQKFKLHRPTDFSGVMRFKVTAALWFQLNSSKTQLDKWNTAHRMWFLARDLWNEGIQLNSHIGRACSLNCTLSFARSFVFAQPYSKLPVFNPNPLLSEKGRWGEFRFKEVFKAPEAISEK